MEICDSLSRTLERRQYRRLEISSTGGFVVQPKRVKVFHFAAAGGIHHSGSSGSSGWRTCRRRRTQRLRLRGCFRILLPSRLMAVVKAAVVRLLQVGRARNCNSRGMINIAKSTIPPPLPPMMMLPRNLPLRSSSNDVIDEVWFQSALQRSIAEGRLQL